MLDLIEAFAEICRENVQKCPYDLKSNGKLIAVKGGEVKVDVRPSASGSVYIKVRGDKESVQLSFDSKDEARKEGWEVK